MLILLVGPKGSGKSHVGRVLERRCGATFFHVEPLWMRYYADCRAAGREPVIADGIAEVHPRIAAALAESAPVVVETTGASTEILDDLLRLRPRDDTLIVRLVAPLERCLARIATRDQTQQIPMDAEMIRRVHALSEAAAIAPDLTLQNDGLSDDAIVAAFAPRLRPAGSGSMLLRPATLADLELLRHWDEQPHVVASDPNDDWQWEIELGRTPEWREQLVAEIDGRPIGFLQLIDPAREETHYWGDVPENLRAIDVWIGAAGDLGRGYGTQMMRLAIARCFADPAVTAILLDPLASNTRVLPFYERLGFRFVERRRFGDDDCLVYRLDRVDDLAARFRASAIPHAEWTHRAHLTVGAWHVHHLGPDEALVRLRAGIRALNDAHGTPNSPTRGYHETITRAYVLLLAEALARRPRAESLAEKTAAILATPLAEREFLLRCYSRGRLMSPAARATWVEPDVAPLGVEA